MKKLDWLFARAEALQEELDEWVRESGLFGEEMKVSVTLTVSPLNVKVKRVAMTPMAGGGKLYYEDVSTDVSAEDWSRIMRSKIPKRFKILLNVIRLNENKPASWEELNKAGPVHLSRLNAAMAKAVVNFRLRMDQKSRTYQVFKVETVRKFGKV